MSLALVCGGRDCSDRAHLFATLDRLRVDRGIDEVIQGGAGGADALAAQWAADRGIPCHTVEADWKAHGRGAGPRRNAEMLKRNPLLVVAFPGGRGTADMVRQARKARVEVYDAPAAVSAAAHRDTAPQRSRSHDAALLAR